MNCLVYLETINLPPLQVLPWAVERRPKSIAHYVEGRGVSAWASKRLLSRHGVCKYAGRPLEAKANVSIF